MSQQINTTVSDLLLAPPRPAHDARVARAIPIAAAPAADSAPASLVRSLLWLEACVLLSLAHVAFVGYRLGVGNQTIQIPFLKWWLNQDLYKNDAMVGATLRDYPSFFFRFLAPLVAWFGLEPTYLVLHLITAFAVLATTYALTVAVSRDRLAGIAALVLLFAGHHASLAGDEIYSLGFTHTWAVFPLAIGVLVLLYHDRLLLAFALCGLIFNVHALTAGYLFVPLIAWALVDRRRLGWLRIIGFAAVFAAVAAPTAIQMAMQRQVFDADWIRYTRIRSADHSFPSTWWRTGDDGVPRFALLLGAAAVAMGFRMKARARRKTLVYVGATAFLFVVGYVLTDLRPTPIVIRAQLYRASRLLMVLALVHAAYGVAAGLRAAVASWQRSGSLPLPRALGLLEAIAAVSVLVTLAVPSLIVFLPVSVTLVTLVALASGRLTGWQAAAAGAAVLVAVVAGQTISFHLPGLGDGATLRTVLTWPKAGAWFWSGVIAAAGLLAMSRMRFASWTHAFFAVEGLAVTLLLGVMIYSSLAASDVRTDPWHNVQAWARDHTPTSAVFLTPARQDGFRVYSERAVVGEWRDGTQAYFTAKFAGDWWKRMSVLLPDVKYNEKGDQIFGGRPLDSLTDPEVLKACAAFRAGYVVLPAGGRHRNLEVAFENERWRVYRPVRVETPEEVVQRERAQRMAAVVPADVIDREAWLDNEEFLRKVARPNIEKHRKADARLAIVDADGRAVEGLAYEVRQTRHAFLFGATLPFFREVPFEAVGDFKPGVVTPRQLELFKELFNFSMIGFGGKPMYIEPIEGQRHYEELDLYVDWCHKNDIVMELHYLSGLQPLWFRQKAPEAQEQFFHEHSRAMAARYGSRIQRWQVVNDKYLMAYSTPVYKELRRTLPADARLGMSDCTHFARSAPGAAAGGPAAAAGGGGPRGRGRPGGGPPARVLDPYEGADEMRALKAEGSDIQFFALHAHSPKGYWPDARNIYDTLDHFAALGVKTTASEIHMPVTPSFPVTGPLRRGAWTFDLQSEFLVWFYTVLFSHPSIEAINYWDLTQNSRFAGVALIDENDKPTAAYHTLKKLIHETWSTRLAGTLPDDAIPFRGFLGDYEVTIKLPSGKTAHKAFKVTADGPNTVQLTLDKETGTLE